MTCDELELSIIEDQPLEAGAAAHVAGCARCSAFQAQTRQLLADAALPEPSAEERAALLSLPGRTLAAWRTQQRRRGLLRQVVGYALAAGLGALVASGVLLKVRPAGSAAAAPAAVTPAAAEVASADVAPEDLLSDDDLHLSDDEVFFDVTWPSNPEGENL